MVDCLADIVEKTCPFCLLFVEAKLGGHYSTQKRYLPGMLENVLGITGSKFQLAYQFYQFGMDAVDPDIERRLFPGLTD